jgi:hypothetical protein
VSNLSKCMITLAMCICLCLGAGASHAWEFSMTGDWTWEYKLYSQMGDNGFFGKFNVSNSTNTTFPGDGAAFNGWLGNEITGDRIVTGADASASTMYIHFKPEIRLNEAVRLRGVYYIGSWNKLADGVNGVGNFQAPEYYTNTIPGVQSSFSPGYWNQFWATAQTPWGIIALGKRPFSFGTGLILDGDDNTTYEGLLYVVPYGPFRLGGAWMPWTNSGAAYTVLSDKNAVQTMRVGGFVTYGSGPMEAGIISEWVNWHGGPESQASLDSVPAATVPNAAGSRRAYVPNDNALNYMTAFVKFNNGRFFFNAEGTYIKVDTHNQRNLANLDWTDLGLAGGHYSAFAPAYIDHARYMTEFGVFSGPAKATFLWAYVEGGVDRRNGIAIDRQADTRALPAFSNYSVFRPYSILFAWDYGAGNGSYTSRANANAQAIGSDNGYVTDANTYAGRLDYAVAANLNVYGSFLWAERISKGYGWGYIAPTSATNPLVNYLYKGTVGNVAPAIPDNALGYEIDGGFDWQLLEGYTLSAAFGYWVPGKWFSYACVDRRVVGWDNAPGAGPYVTGGSWGVTPGRTIDPVFGMDLQVKVEF